jgi:hypothetical protein
VASPPDSALGPRDRYFVIAALPFHRGFGVRSFKMHELLVHGISDLLILDALLSRDLSPSSYTMVHVTCYHVTAVNFCPSEFRGLRHQCARTLWTRDSPIPDPPMGPGR